MLDTLSTIIEMLLQLPTPEAYVDAAGSSSAMLQQVAQHIVDLTQQLLGCSHVCLLVVDHNTKIFIQQHWPDSHLTQTQRFRANGAGFRLNDLLIDPEMIVRLEEQEMLRSISHSLRFYNPYLSWFNIQRGILWPFRLITRSWDCLVSNFSKLTTIH